jgi:hypothetical protein
LNKSSGPHYSCNRTFQGRTGWKKQCVKQPDCVKFYIEGMLDGMQVDLKSECFTPESRPNKDFARDSLNSN